MRNPTGGHHQLAESSSQTQGVSEIQFWLPSSPRGSTPTWSRGLDALGLLNPGTVLVAPLLSQQLAAGYHAAGLVTIGNQINTLDFLLLLFRILSKCRRFPNSRKGILEFLATSRFRGKFAFHIRMGHFETNQKIPPASSSRATGASSMLP